MVTRFNVNDLRIPKPAVEEILRLVRGKGVRPGFDAYTGSSAIMSKLSLARSPDASSLAWKKFLASEVAVREAYRPFNFRYLHDDTFASIIDRARYHIRKALGRFSAKRMVNLSRFGPGAAIGMRSRDVTGPRKLGNLTVTKQLSGLASNIILAYFPSWAEYLSQGTNACPLLKVVEGSRVSFVPKNNEIDRTILVEPNINVFFQLGIGQMMRERVESYFRLDLADQTLNQRLAWKGSLDSSLFTLDLSSASDTIGCWLVEFLLPEDWNYWLRITRSDFCITPSGESMFLSKISSMGNGYTWDLETLIFHSLMVSVCELQGYNTFWCATFGDDMVGPSGAFESLCDVLTSCGFLVNPKKSFHKDFFRESCGADYCKGMDVRPIFLRKLEVWPDVVSFVNNLRSWPLASSSERILADQLEELLPKFLRRLSCPTQNEDGTPFVSQGALIRPFDVALPRAARLEPRYLGWEGWLFDHLVPVAKRVYDDTPLRLLHGLRCAGTLENEEYGNQIPVKEIDHYRVTRSLSRVW